MLYRSLLIPLLLGISLPGCSQEEAQEAGIHATPEVPPAAEPTEAEDPLAVARFAQGIHESVLILDAHADIELPEAPSRYAGPDGVSRVAPEKMRAGGVDAVVMAVAVGPGPRDEAGVTAARAAAEAEVAAVQALVADPANDLVLATTVDQVLAAHAAGQGALILGFQNARIFGTDLTGMDDFHAAGVRVFALTHMGHNDFADSSRPVYDGDTGTYEPDAEHGGLSELGKAAIARINALGAVVDVSQLSRQATLQVLALSSAPVIASHSNVQALSNVRRNLSDEEIDAIGANGGVIHIAAFKGYLFDSSDAALDASIRAARRQAGIPEDYDYPFELYWELGTLEAQQAFVAAVS
jgi:membrane dipeptidase